MVATTLAQQLVRNRVPANRRMGFGIYAVAVIVLGAALVVHDLPDLPATLGRINVGFWIMAILAVAADARPVTLPGKWNTAAIYPSICFTFAIMLIYGTAAAVLVQSLAVIVASWQLRHAAWRAAFNIGQYAVAIGLAHLMYQAMPVEVPSTPWRLPAIVAAATVWFAAKYLLTVLAIYIKDAVAWWPTVLGPLFPEAITTGALLMLAPAIMMNAGRRPEFILAFILPLFAVRRLAIMTAHQRHLARVDPLTGLANRKALIAEVTAAIADHSQRAVQGDAEDRFALLLLDLDRFKRVNDALGHEVGDRLLIAVGDRLASVVRGRPGDMVARLGGDEFAIVAKWLDDPATQARDVAQRIEEALVAPVVVDGLPLDVGGSIGIALYPEHGTDFATLLRRADVAMYSAKHRGHGIAFYNPETDQNSPQSLSLLADLRTALAEPDGGGLSLEYQPQIEISTGNVVAIEALLRWRHPYRGQISPEDIIRVAEHSPVMRLLTLWALEQAVHRLAMWAIIPRIAVNVSVRDLHQADIVERIDMLLRRYNVEPRRLQLEITESALMADPHRVLATLTRLHRLGVGVALDDFGTGYSSMQHLRRLPLTEVKIDRSFVMGMVADQDDRAIVCSIIELAGALGLRVVAEGVETKQALCMLHSAGCDVGQGWYYTKPLTANEIPEWLAVTEPPLPELIPSFRISDTKPRTLL